MALCTQWVARGPNAKQNTQLKASFKEAFFSFTTSPSRPFTLGNKDVFLAMRQQQSNNTLCAY